MYLISAHFAYFNSSIAREQPAMIISPYYQHTSIECTLRFKYRLFGQPGAAIEITTQHRSLIDATEHDNNTPEYYDDDDSKDWTRPTLHASYKAQNNFIDSLVLFKYILMQ